MFKINASIFAAAFLMMLIAQSLAFKNKDHRYSSESESKESSVSMSTEEYIEETTVEETDEDDEMTVRARNRNRNINLVRLGQTQFPPHNFPIFPPQQSPAVNCTINTAFCSGCTFTTGASSITTTCPAGTTCGTTCASGMGGACVVTCRCCCAYSHRTNSCFSPRNCVGMNPFSPVPSSRECLPTQTCSCGSPIFGFGSQPFCQASCM